MHHILIRIVTMSSMSYTHIRILSSNTTKIRFVVFEMDINPNMEFFIHAGIIVKLLSCRLFM